MSSSRFPPRRVYASHSLVSVILATLIPRVATNVGPPEPGRDCPTQARLQCNRVIIRFSSQTSHSDVAHPPVGACGFQASVPAAGYVQQRDIDRDHEVEQSQAALLRLGIHDARISVSSSTTSIRLGVTRKCARKPCPGECADTGTRTSPPGRRRPARRSGDPACQEHTGRRATGRNTRVHTNVVDRHQHHDGAAQDIEGDHPRACGHAVDGRHGRACYHPGAPRVPGRTTDVDSSRSRSTYQ